MRGRAIIYTGQPSGGGGGQRQSKCKGPMASRAGNVRGKEKWTLLSKVLDDGLGRSDGGRGGSVGLWAKGFALYPNCKGKLLYYF